MKRLYSIVFMVIITTVVFAQGPNNTKEYYKAADGKKGAALKTALHNIIRGSYPLIKYSDNTPRSFKPVSYSGLFGAYEDTDLRDDGRIWDMYSNKTSNNFKGFLPTQHTGNYSGEGDMYNREHTTPQSWFDGTENVEKCPMYSDLFNVYPTDGFINNMRSNYPYGETYSATTSGVKSSENGFSKLGPSKLYGYSGKVFEPNDLYKGDLARTYFYMVTCYQDKILNLSEGSDVYYGTDADSYGNSIVYPGLKEWTLNMFIDWAHNDEVSTKETNRNEAVAKLQYNRNPFIDYPGLEQYIWGSMKDVAFSYDNYQVPETYSHYVSDGTNPSIDPVDPTPSEGEQVYTRVNSTADLEVGAKYIIVCEEKSMAMAEQGSNIRNNAELSLTGSSVTTEVNKSGKPYEITLGGEEGAYTLYDATGDIYLAFTKNENKIHTATSAAGDATQWEITFDGNNALIKSKRNNAYSIQYNSSSPRFCCYQSKQTPVQLYKHKPIATGVRTVSWKGAMKQDNVIYDMQGRRVGTIDGGMPRLQKGVYIIRNRKVVVK